MFDHVEQTHYAKFTGYFVAHQKQLVAKSKTSSVTYANFAAFFETFDVISLFAMQDK